VNATKFYTRAIGWLRDERSLDTEVRAGTQLEPQPSGGARIRGWFAPPSRAGSWAFAGLCVLALGSVLAMLNPPGLSPGARINVERVGHVAQGAGATCLLAAEMKRRRNRTPAIVELRAGATTPATPESVVSLWEESQGSAAWIVSERSLSHAALAAASEHGVRCFVLRGGRFSEDGEPSTQTPIHGRGQA